MTVSTQVATLMTVDETVLHSYQLAGLISIEIGLGDPGWASKATFGRRALSIILSELATQGIFARFQVFHEVTLTADTDRYTLPTWVLDVVGDGAYIPEGQDLENADSESVLTKLSMEQWQGLSNRSATSQRPTTYYAHRGTSGYQIELRLWPIPEESGTVRLQVQRYNSDALEGAATIDLEPYWQDYLTSALAHRVALASGLPASRLALLATEREMLRDKARGKANESTQMQVALDHPAGWNR